MALPKLGKCCVLIPVVLVLGAGLLYTGYAFRIRDSIPATSDVCHSTTGRCISTSTVISPAFPSSSSSWSTMTSLRAKRGFETVSTRGSFAKSRPRPPDEAYKEQNSVAIKKNSKTSTSRSWSKLSKIQDSDEENNRDSDENKSFPNSDEEHRKKIDNDDEIIQIEIVEEEIVKENEDHQKILKDKLSHQKKKVIEKRNEKEQEVRLIRLEETRQKIEKEEERRQKEKENQEKKREEEIQRRIERDLQEQTRLKDEERRRKEEKEKLQQKRDEDYRRKKEQEEQRIKEEVARRLKEEEERRLKVEAENRRKEEEEQRLREEEKNRLKEEEKNRLKEKEEQRLKMEEEERLKKELERQLKEEEEHRLKEEEERLKREKKQKILELEQKEAKKVKDDIENRKRLEKMRNEENKFREEKEKRKVIESNANKDEKDYEDEVNNENNERTISKLANEREKIIVNNKDKDKSLEIINSKPNKVVQIVNSESSKSRPNVKTSNKVEADNLESATIKKTVNDETKATKPRPKKGPEGFLSLTELNDMILSVPTFVPNFTAVEDLDCQNHGKIFLRQLRGYKLWALQMLDSSAKIPAGLLRGNVNQLGDFDQCLGIMARVKVDEKTVKIQGKYCLASMDVYATHLALKLPVNLMQSRALIRGNMHDPGYFIPKFTTINWGVCLPAACSAEDARRSIEDALKIYNMTIGIRFMVDIDPKMCYVKQKLQNYSKETIGVLYFYAIFICLVIVATIRDYFATTQEKGNYSERIIMAFSLKRTTKVLFGNKEMYSSHIGCIHGIRSLSTMALYMLHKMIPTSRMPYANRVSLTEVASNPLTSVLRTSLFYTDSLLLLSGVVTAYNMTNELANRGEIRWFCRFIVKFIRLTPSLLAVIFWYAFVMEHTGSGPQWNTAVKANADICKENAWINLLYVQNFFPFEEMCATHTHHLALDMQLSLIAPVVVFFLQIKPIVGVIIVFFLLQVSATLRYLATSNNNLSLVIFHGMTVKQLYKTANMTYLLSVHRATPYLFGVTLGVILHYTGKTVRIHKIFTLVGWLIALALGSWSLFSPWHFARRDYIYNNDEATQYAVLSPIFTAVALSWTIFACFTENGGIVNKVLSNHWMIVFSRLSYAFYLSQFIIFFYNVGTTRYSSEFQLHKIIDFYEVISVASVSIVLTLLFDIPMQEVRKIVLESTDSLSAENEKPKENVVFEENHKEVKKLMENINLEDEEESHPGHWNWNRGTFTKITKSEPRDCEATESDESFRSSKIMRQNVRRQTMTRSEAYDEWDQNGMDRRISRSEEHSMDNGRMNRIDYKMNNARFDDELLTENYVYPREQYYSNSYTRSPVRDSSFYRSSSRERSKSKDVEILARDYNNKPIITISKEEDYKNSRPSRSSASRFFDQQFSLSESEIDVVGSRRNTNNFDRRSSAELRMSDEDDWENDLRFRRNRYQRERVHSQESERLPPPVVEEEINNEWDSLKRRSSAEGKMALLKEPLRPGNMELWTVSKMQFGSSQESDDELDEEVYLQQRREYREQGPPLREEFEEDEGNDEEELRKNIALERRALSFDEGDEITNSFVLNKNSKRITVQDLSILSADDETVKDSGWNNLDVKSNSSGLFKRESIVKSQASEEDPEYLLPERPKLVEQEQEHPFKKAWQMQKSRSEEEGSSGFVIKDYKASSASFEKQNKELDNKNEDGKSNNSEQPMEVPEVDIKCDGTPAEQGCNNEIDTSESSSNFVTSSILSEPNKEELNSHANIKKPEEENLTCTDRDT